MGTAHEPFGIPLLRAAVEGGDVTLRPYAAVALGLSVPRLDRLSQFYAVPVEQLLPREVTGSQAAAAMASSVNKKLAIDVAKLVQLKGAPFEMLARYLKLIQVQRQDFNGRVITVRGDDTRSIAAMLDVPVDQVAERLAALDLLFVPAV